MQVLVLNFTEQIVNNNTIRIVSVNVDTSIGKIVSSLLFIAR